MLTWNFSSKDKLTLVSSKFKAFELWLSVSIGLRISDKKDPAMEYKPYVKMWIPSVDDEMQRTWPPCVGGPARLPCELLRAGWFRLLPAVSNYSSEKLRNQYRIKANLFSFFCSPFRSRKQTAGDGDGGGSWRWMSQAAMTWICVVKIRPKKGFLFQPQPGCGGL